MIWGQTRGNWWTPWILFFSEKGPSAESHNQEMNDGRQASREGREGADLKGKAGLQSEQTCEIFLSLLKNGSGGSELAQPLRRDVLLKPLVSAAGTTKVAVVQHFTAVSCCRGSTCVISSNSRSASETGPSYYNKPLSKYLTATEFSLVRVNCPSDASKYYKMCVFHTLSQKPFGRGSSPGVINSTADFPC